jgi:hypothetical protein
LCSHMIEAGAQGCRPFSPAENGTADSDVVGGDIARWCAGG